jgi:hypothetical protein
MNPSLRSLARRVAPNSSSAPPPLDAAFVARVRERLEPVLAPTGFVFARTDGGTSDEDRPAHATVVRFEVDAEPFVARYPGAAGHLRTEGSPLELWAELDHDRDAVRFELESWHLSALLAVVRSGPGAPPRRRQLDDDTVTALAPDAALDRAVDLLRRLFDAAASR